MHILIVEDEERLAKALKKGLELKGYAVDWLPDSEKARNRILSGDLCYSVGPVRTATTHARRRRA